MTGQKSETFIAGDLFDTGLTITYMTLVYATLHYNEHLYGSLLSMVYHLQCHITLHCKLNNKSLKNGDRKTLGVLFPQ